MAGCILYKTADMWILSEIFYQNLHFYNTPKQQASQEEQAAETRAQLAKIGQAAVAEPDAMERCLAALDVVEGSAVPARPASPPATTDRISYDDSLRIARLR